MSYAKLKERFKRISALEHMANIADWDRSVFMPSGGAEARGEALAEVGGFMHELTCDPQVSEWLESAKNENLDSWNTANLRHIERAHKLSTAVSTDVVSRKIALGVRCGQAWETLRPQNNWQDFLPLLKDVVDVSREEAAQRAQSTKLSAYQSLVDLYSPGQKVEEIEIIFARLKEFLLQTIQKITEKQKTEPHYQLLGPFNIEKQKQLCLETMQILGFDFKRGRLDVSHHPFCGGVSRDVRITTRYAEHDLAESLMGVIHETGHASYEQGLPQLWAGQPVGTALGMTLHESQSLLFEMQMARSPEFLGLISPLLTKIFGARENEFSTHNLAHAFTRVQPDYIRTSADEVTYPLHVVLRFEIEKDLIEGRMDVKDLPEVWNLKMQKYLGVDTTQNYKDGCMQDMHWAFGSFGYFPSYTLGALTAAQLFAKAKQQMPSLMSDISRGDLTGLHQWLQQKIWSQASLLSKTDLLIAATGEDLNPQYFIDHVNARYLGIENRRATTQSRQSDKTAEINSAEQPSQL